MLALTTRSYSVTVDPLQEKVFFVSRGLFHADQQLRVIPFTDVEQVQLSSWEDSYSIPDEYTSQTYTRRTWVISLVLRDGTSATIAEESSDQGFVGRMLHAEDGVRWEALAATVSELLGKPLVRTGDVPGGPHTFVETIDWILQQRLRQSGPSNISVHLRTAKDLGIEIVVNGKVFTAIDQVEPETVRHLIREAINEWQTGAGHDI